ncbi:MAG: hypothetical protein JWL59_4060 [Chthoniobacteraceae bacterium]|nr:hypothetical protein [Chthoniobacteraceae bacterium]
MHEVFLEAITFVNLPFTVLLGLIVLYWVMVVIGALDSTFGSEFDGHLESGTESSSDHDANHDGWISGLAHFINLGDVPLMVVMSVITLSLWTGSLIANRYVTGHQTLLALACLIPNLLISIVVTRYITLPLKPLFRMLRRNEDDAVPIVGQPCRILTSQVTGTFGQAEITTQGAPLLINVRTLDGSCLPKGAIAIVVREDRERDFYFVTAFPDPQMF